VGFYSSVLSVSLLNSADYSSPKMKSIQVSGKRGKRDIDVGREEISKKEAKRSRECHLCISDGRKDGMERRGDIDFRSNEHSLSLFPLGHNDW